MAPEPTLVAKIGTVGGVGVGGGDDCTKVPTVTVMSSFSDTGLGYLVAAWSLQTEGGGVVRLE